MEINYCPGCGSKIAPGAKFCPGCGVNLADKGEKPSPAKNRQFLLAMLPVVTVLVVAIAFFFYTSKKKPSEPAQEHFEHPPIQGMPAGTMPDYDNIIATLPKSYDSLVNAGNHFMDNQIFRLAVECYSRALAIDSSDPNIYTDLGACYHYLGEKEKAIQAFDKALAINPNHPIAHFNMGIVYRELNNLEKTRYHWNKFVELDPKASIADSIRKYLDNLGNQ
jgi:tetratricopeptide (TPR) repeat protein